MTDPAPHRGEVWLATLDKVRPVVVLTRDPMGHFLNAVTVAPVTSTVRGVSTEVLVGPEDGVRLESVVNLDNVQLVARTRFVRRVGQARTATMGAVCRALSIATGCERSRGAATAEARPTR
jgi:mRNA interferase MazF